MILFLIVLDSFFHFYLQFICSISFLFSHSPLWEAQRGYANLITFTFHFPCSDPLCNCPPFRLWHWSHNDTTNQIKSHQIKPLTTYVLILHCFYVYLWPKYNSVCQYFFLNVVNFFWILFMSLKYDFMCRVRKLILLVYFMDWNLLYTFFWLFLF